MTLRDVVEDAILELKLANKAAPEMVASTIDAGDLAARLQAALNAGPQSKAIHIPKVHDELIKNLRAYIAKVKAGAPLTDGNGFPIVESHNAMQAIDNLAMFAGFWEVHCRDNGLSPYTGMPGKMYPKHGWEGFEEAATSDEWNAQLRRPREEGI